MTFTSTSTDPDGQVVQWAWSFGDGTAAPGEIATHAYAQDGIFAVTLTATDDSGNSESIEEEIEVQEASPPPNQPPTASFSMSPLQEQPFPIENQLIDFFSTSIDNDGSIVSWHWEFGDETTAPDNQNSEPSHSYSASGAYTVSLTVTDDKGAIGTTSQTIIIEQGTCTFPPDKKRDSTEFEFKHKCPPLGIVGGAFQFSGFGLYCLEQRDIDNSGKVDCLYEVKEDAQRNRFELWCMQNPLNRLDVELFWYALVYRPAGASDNETKIAGKCPYGSGRNSHNIFYVKDENALGLENLEKIGCFLGSSWTSRDLGVDDDRDGKQDWWTFYFNTSTNFVYGNNYESTIGPAGMGPNVVESFYQDPPPSFNSLPPILNIDDIPIDGPMTFDTFSKCDLNRNGTCDSTDSQIFNAALGTCAGAPTYHSLADIDSSGCVDTQDEHFLYIADDDEDGVPNASDNCKMTSNSNQVDRDNDGVGDACDTNIATCNGLKVTTLCRVNGVANQLCQGTSRNDTIIGTSGDDVIVGDSGADIILGQSGTDLICGGPGKDNLAGGTGNDVMFGGNDNDILVGGPGSDLLLGESGNDLLSGGSGTDACIGGEIVAGCDR